ncbi:chromosome partitioning protein [Micromonospora sp. NPDC000089]|uniref:MinD/ParA family ATP-binding protein n=1 Tax=unclassified Micromonospora TaxID=2617518 RepID=UPI0036B193D8
MVDENADRGRLPGRQPPAERDIEPLWPPEPADPGPAWGGPQPVTYPSLHAEVGPAPSFGWTPNGEGYDPTTRPSPDQPAPVDLDLPFTLDRAVAPEPRPAPAEPARRPTAAPAPRHGDQAGRLRPERSGPPPARPGEPEPAASGPEPAASTPGPAGSMPAPAAHGPGRDGLEGAPGTPVVARNESPWSQPPQRSVTDEAVGTATVPGHEVPPPEPPKLGPFPPSPGTPLGPFPPPPPTSPAPPTAVPPPPGQPTPPGPTPHPELTPQPGSTPQPGLTQYAWPTAPLAPTSQPGPAPQPPAWQQGTPYTGLPQQSYPQPQPAAGFPDPTWAPEGGGAPTAEDFARRRQVRPADPVATLGVRAVVNRIGLVKLPPGRHEQELRQDIEMVRRNFGGLRQVTVVNPKGGAGKTVAILLLAMTFGQKRGGYVLAWDNNETQGTLGMRAQQDFHSRTVRDMLRDLGQFQGAHGRIGDLSQYVRSQGEGMFDVLASDESATGGEMLTAAAFAEIRDVVSRFYKLIFVDTGNNVRAQNWQAAMDATDQLVVTMSARNDSAETAARMLDHLEQSGRHRLVRQAVTVVSMPPSRKELDLPAIEAHFAARTRAVLLAPYERLIDTGEPIRYAGLSSATRDAWLKIAAAVAEGL